MKESNLVRVILARHGETEWNKMRWVQGGNSDTQLSQRGIEQAESLALRLKQERLQAIYSSPLQRALDTAQAIARHHQLEVQIEPALKEMNVGGLEGAPVTMIGKRLDQLLTVESQGEALHSIPEVESLVEVGQNVWNAIHHLGGESLAELQQRAWSTIERLVSKHSESVIVVVSHYFVILTIICAALNLPLSQMGRLRLDTASISTIVFDEPVTRLILFNDKCHLVTPS